MKVAFVTPPLKGHKHRGIGNYAIQLFKALESQKNHVEVQRVTIGQNYSNFDIIHYPYFDPFFLTLPLLKRKPTVVTIHDLIPFKYPQYFPKGLKGTIKWNIQKLSLFSVSAVLTDSFASQKDICTFTGLSKEFVNVIYLAPGNEYRILKDKRKLEICMKKLCLPDKFILYVGDVNYNKNVKGLLMAFTKVLKIDSSLRLVLAGSGFEKDSPELDEIKNMLRFLQLVDKVKILGFLKTEDLVYLYNLATIYIQPSFAEGFGLPVLEAMRCGCPVIASNTSSLKEIIDDAVIKIDPYNEKEFIDAILILIDSGKKRQALIKRGITQSRKFSWEKCAQETIQVYEEIYK